MHGLRTKREKALVDSQDTCHTRQMCDISLAAYKCAAALQACAVSSHGRCSKLVADL